jgi:thioredoxin 2
LIVSKKLMSIITCSKCGAKNRVDEARVGQELPKCGRCGTPLTLSDGHPLTITDANFASEVMGAGALPVLVDCWATWCPPCKAIAPTIEQLAAESAGRWKIGKLDVDANPRTARQFHIDSIPTLLIFKSGKLVDTVVGLNPKPAIVARLEKWT